MAEEQRYFGLQWHITNRCDQRCKHCYIYQTENGASSGEDELSEDSLAKILDSFLEFCSQNDCLPGVTITGGDPLLSPSFWKLAKRMQKKDLLFSILGNPFHLNQTTCEKLRDYGCRSYQLSLDGLETTHDKLRKRGSFRETLRAVDVLKKYGKDVSVKIMATVSRLNYRELPALADLCVEIGVDSFTYARYSPTHNDLEHQLSPAEYRSFLVSMWEVYCKKADKGTRFPLKDHLWSLFLYEIGKMELGSGDAIVDGCNCGIRHTTILPDGTVYACRRFTSPVGNILTTPLSDIFFGPEMECYRQFDRFEACVDCELLRFCRGCPAIAYGATGNFYARDPQCWK